jgi:hypothetical protein
MEPLNPEILQRLRTLARSGSTPSQIARELFRQVDSQPHPRLTALKYLREAFGLSLRQVSPVGGWSADGTGELTDAQLDALLQPAIEQTRAQWQVSNLSSSV